MEHEHIEKSYLEMERKKYGKGFRITGCDYALLNRWISKEKEAQAVNECKYCLKEI